MRWRFAVRKAKGRIASPGRWLPGPGTESVAYVDGSGANPRFVATDERGSVVADYDKASIQTYRYGPHGEPDSGGSPDRLGYAGGIDVAELGIVIMGARVYSPALGRFLQTDPIGIAGGANVYDYAGGDPVNGVDPSGLACRVINSDSNGEVIECDSEGEAEDARGSNPGQTVYGPPIVVTGSLPPPAPPAFGSFRQPSTSPIGAGPAVPGAGGPTTAKLRTTPKPRREKPERKPCSEYAFAAVEFSWSHQDTNWGEVGILTLGGALAGARGGVVTAGVGAFAGGAGDYLQQHLKAFRCTRPDY